MNDPHVTAAAASTVFGGLIVRSLGLATGIALGILLLTAILTG